MTTKEHISLNDYDKAVIKSKLEDYLSSLVGDVEKSKFHCPICKDKDGLGFIPDTNRTMWKCFSGKHSGPAYPTDTGDIFTFVQQHSNCDYAQACDLLGNKYGIGNQKSYNIEWNGIINAEHTDTLSNFGQSINTNEENNTAKKEFIANQIKQDFISSLEHSKETDYLLNRGISWELQERFNIGFIPQWISPTTAYKQSIGEISKTYPTPRIIIPTSDTSYLARVINKSDEGENGKYKALKAGKVCTFNAKSLQDNQGYCFIVEGEIDALSCLEVGFNAIGLGSVQYIDILFKQEINNDNVLIWALDNDEAGATALPKGEKLCKQHGIPYIISDVSTLFGGCKDANELLIKDRSLLETNLTEMRNQALNMDKEQFLKDISEQFAQMQNQEAIEDINSSSELLPVPEQEKRTLPYYFYLNDNQKISVSPPLLADYIRKQSNYIFVRNNATEGVNRYLYNNGVYCLISDDELKGYIKSFISMYSETYLKMTNVNEVFNNIITDLNFIHSEELNSNENIINFQNGLLYLDTMELKPHTPNIYTTIQIPCNWNPTANQSPTFNRYLNELTENDKEKQNLLLQFMGVCISNLKGYRLKKSLFMVGAGDTGKSQLRQLTDRLIGLNNTSSITLSELEKRFGTSNVFNKRVVGDADMSFMAVKELKMFKQLTGGDSVPVEFKCKTPFNYTYNGLLWFCMNELPKFGGDRGQWVYDRIIVMHFNNVIPKNKQDKLLCDKMFAEREAIVNMAVLALKEVIKQGINFSIPESCILENEQYQKDNSPVYRFYEECCIERPQTGKYDGCTTTMLYKVFAEWCKENNNGYIVKKQDFNKELLNIFKVNDIKQIQSKDSKGIRYYTFTINLETKQEFNNIYRNCDSVQ